MMIHQQAFQQVPNYMYGRTWNDRFLFSFTQTFRNYDFRGKRLLDVGGGSGQLSFFASASGAEQAVCLEPEDAGSTAGVASRFEQIRDGTGLHTARLVRTTFQQYAENHSDQFDVLVCDSAINHLDEDAVQALHFDHKAREKYADILIKMHGLLVLGGRAIIIDSMRRNLFGDLRLRNPFCPSIEWRKHQNPATWISLFHANGFRLRRKEWRSINRFGETGRLLFGTTPFAYLYGNTFILEFERL